MESSTDKTRYHQALFMSFMALAAVLAGLQKTFPHREPLLWSFLVLLLFNYVHLSVSHRWLSERRYALVSIGANIILVGVVIYFSNGRDSFFWVLYFLPLFTATLSLDKKRILGTLAACCFVLALPYASSLAHRQWVELLPYLIQSATLILVGITMMITALGERLAKQRFAQEHALREEERMQLSDRLQHADRLATLGTLVASMAHEVGNPLGTILGICELHKTQEFSPEESRRQIQLVENAAARCKQILEGIMLFSRKRQAEPTPHDINEAIRQCAALKKYDLFQKIQLMEDYDPLLPEVVLIPTELQQVIFNLLTNAQHAILAAKESGRIWIRTHLVGDVARIVVEDDGPGIPPEVLPRIFEAFYTTKAPGQGTGLGLSISKQLVEALGGTISVQSAPGRGASFTIELPIAQRAKQQPN